MVLVIAVDMAVGVVEHLGLGEQAGQPSLPITVGGIEPSGHGIH